MAATTERITARWAAQSIQPLRMVVLQWRLMRWCREQWRQSESENNEGQQREQWRREQSNCTQLVSERRCGEWTVHPRFYYHCSIVTVQQKPLQLTFYYYFFFKKWSNVMVHSEPIFDNFFYFQKIVKCNQTVTFDILLFIFFKKWSNVTVQLNRYIWLSIIFYF